MQIENSIKKILVNELFVEVPEAEMGLDDGLQTVFGLDSLGFVELRFQCEQTFGVQISDEYFDNKNFSSIRTVANLIQELQAMQTAK